MNGLAESRAHINAMIHAHSELATKDGHVLIHSEHGSRSLPAPMAVAA
jgi:hypothetical protein